MTDVVIVGAGPTGLMLACELRLHGVRVTVLDRLAAPDPAPKANGLVGPVVQLLDYRGIYERITGSAGPPRPTPMFMFGGFPLDLRGLADNPVFTLPVPQRRLEEVLAARAIELGAEIRRGVEVVNIDEHDNAVTIDLVNIDSVNMDSANIETIDVHYVVGGDGAHSTVRKLAGIEFAGVTEENFVSRNASVRLPVTATGDLDVPGVGRFHPYMQHRTPRGVFSFASFSPGSHILSVYEWEPAPDDDSPLTLDEIRASFRRVVGADVDLEEAPGVRRRSVSRNTRQADRFRAGRVFLAGDAAHVFTGFGGPGLNLALHDAANLGWKLAAAVHGWAPPDLLDTYHAERHPAAARVAVQTQAQTALLAPGTAVTALRTIVGDLLEEEPARRRIASWMTGLDERWLPDRTVSTVDGPVRLAELMRRGRPLLIGKADIDGWADRVDVIESADEPLLVRPDGLAAWRGVGSLTDALTRWFGTPSRN
jgi:2-polyprenyl-6-methoxyphenol hydroxylase-like FAD-dependent oxidoreductase